jgi:hypothetical protein
MKKKIFLVFSLICLTGYFLNAQNYIIQVKPVDSKTWKYANIKGEIIIDCNFPVSYQFSEDGIAAAYHPKKNLYYLVNSKGQVLDTEIKNFFLKDAFGYGARGYFDGLVVVRMNKTWGCLDTAGKIAIPIKYDYLTEFHDGYGIGQIDNNFYIIDKTGKETLVENRYFTDIKHFSEHLAPFTIEDDTKGFIDEKGKIVIPAQYLEVGYFSGGLAWAKNYQKLIGFINHTGEWVIKPQFLAVKSFDPESGLARVKNSQGWAYTNIKGEIIYVNISETIDDFYEGLAKGKIGDLVGFYNNKGEWAIQPQFEGVRDFHNGFAAAKLNGLWGIVDREGKWTINPVFDGIRDVVKLK